MKFRAIVNITCGEHPEGHQARIYSGPTDEAWFLGEVLARECAAHGYFTSVAFESRGGAGGWERQMPPDFSTRPIHTPPSLSPDDDIW